MRRRDTAMVGETVFGKFEGKVEKNPMTVLKRFSRRTIEAADLYVKSKNSDFKIATLGVREARVAKAHVVSK